jgi:ribosomal protein S4
MPQAQPELKKVRKAPFHPYARHQSRGTRQLENRDGKSKQQEKWTDPRLQYLDKRLFVQLNGSRKVIGVLRGYDVCFPAPLRWRGEG